MADLDERQFIKHPPHPILMGKHVSRNDNFFTKYIFFILLAQHSLTANCLSTKNKNYQPANKQRHIAGEKKKERET